MTREAIKEIFSIRNRRHNGSTDGLFSGNKSPVQLTAESIKRGIRRRKIEDILDMARYVENTKNGWDL